jgi:predicted ATP-grasp superfamily ATP-dependent carboligase
MDHPGGILVVPGDTFIALTVIRSLGRRGVRVVAMSSPDGIARNSRYCAAVHEMPADKGDLPAAVLQVVRLEKLSHIVATSDPAILRLNRVRAGLEEEATLLFPAPEAAALAIHKDKTLELARGVGVPCPAGLILNSEADLPAAAHLRFPVVLKPRHQDIAAPGRFPAFKIKHCASYEELARALAPFHASGDYPLIQEYCPGYGIGVEVLMRRGRPLLLFQHRRVREFPIEGGVSTCCESMPLDPKLRDWSVALLQAMNWDGVAMVEFRHDDASGRSVLMEVNGRFWGSLPLAVQAGCDFPYELYRSSLAPDAPADPPPYRAGLRSRLLAAETKWLMQALRHRTVPRWRALAEYLLAFRPGTKYYAWAWDDPRPAIDLFLSRWRRLAH